ncbi:hypothetical protein [Catenulispora rubra]|uniref:hypothetical protein n=1 Tax=Catenulispora rubra TaxID=280293 RepID=UPI00189255D0|nr:hypothetical protein [Catenulispora rubra]
MKTSDRQPQTSALEMLVSKVADLNGVPMRRLLAERTPAERTLVLDGAVKQVPVAAFDAII